MSTDIRETHHAADRHERRGTAIVVGASLSGLMTGLTLSRAGFHVTMLERSGPSPQSGAALGLVGVDLHGETKLLDGSNRTAPSLIAI
ncbi:FAD-dependent monooxygenase, partial [Streptomyces sp. NPDC004561]